MCSQLRISVSTLGDVLLLLVKTAGSPKIKSEFLTKSQMGLKVCEKTTQVAFLEILSIVWVYLYNAIFIISLCGA